MLWGQAAVPAFRPLVVVPCLVKGLLGAANPAAAWDAPVAKAAPVPAGAITSLRECSDASAHCFAYDFIQIYVRLYSYN